MAVADGIEMSRDGLVRWRAPQLGERSDAGEKPTTVAEPQPTRAHQQQGSPVQKSVDPSSGGGMLTAGQIESWEAEAKAEGIKQGRDEGLEQGRKDGFAEGFEKGLAEGRAEGKREQQQQVALLKSLLEQMQSPLKNTDEELHNTLLSLSVAMAQQLVRREIQIEPGEIIPVITEALALLPSHAKDIVVHVHPEDAKLIRDLLTDTVDDSDWSIAEDPLLTRGGCRVESQDSSIDASLEARLAGLMAAHINGRRQSD